MRRTTLTTSRAFRLASLLLTTTSLSECRDERGARSSDDARRASDLIATIHNATRAPLVDAYAADGDRCITEAERADAGRASARACFARVDEAWAPIWSARRVVQLTQNEIAEELRAGGASPASLERLHAAYCALRDVARTRVSLPTIGAACEPPALQ